MLIQEPFSDDLIRTPLKVDSPALPGAQEWNPTSLKGSESIARARGGHPLADEGCPGPVRACETPSPLVILTPP